MEKTFSSPDGIWTHAFSIKSRVPYHLATGEYFKALYKDKLILSQSRKPFPPKSQFEASTGFEPALFFNEEFAVSALFII